MKSFLSDSNEEAIVEFVKQHKELYKTHMKFENKPGKECLWERLVAQCTRYGSLTHTKSGKLQ